MLWRHPPSPASSCQIGNEIDIGGRNESKDQYRDGIGFTYVFGNRQSTSNVHDLPPNGNAFAWGLPGSNRAPLENFRQLIVVFRNARSVRAGHCFPVVNKKTHELLPESALTLTFSNSKFGGKCIAWSVGACYLFVLCTLSACTCYFHLGFN